MGYRRILHEAQGFGGSPSVGGNQETQEPERRESSSVSQHSSNIQQSLATRIVGVVAVACAVATVWAVPAVNASPDVAAHAAKKTTSPVGKRALERKKARIRRELRRAVRRNAVKAFSSRGFLRRADFSDFALPVTIRLRPGTQIGTTILPARWPFDEFTHPQPAGEQLLDLAGQFSGEIQFSSNGYGIVGTLQARAGMKTNLTTMGPLRLAELDCGLTPPDPRPAFIEATPTAPFAMTSGAPSWVSMNPFTGSSDGYLYLNWSFTSRVLRSDATCGAPGDAGDFAIPAALPSTAPLPYQPTRVAWQGAFRVAPSITADGALRFGKIVADHDTTAQPASTGNLWTCAPTALVGSQPAVPVGSTCAEQSAPFVPPMEEMTATPLAAQFQFKHFYADVLLGNVPLPSPSTPLVPGP